MMGHRPKAHRTKNGVGSPYLAITIDGDNYELDQKDDATAAEAIAINKFLVRIIGGSAPMSSMPRKQAKQLFEQLDERTRRHFRKVG